MSSRDHYRRDALPPIRDVLGDQLDRPPHHDSAYSFDAVGRALPSTTTSSSRSRSTWPQTTGPTLPPIHPHGYPSTAPTTPSYHHSHPSHKHPHAHYSSSSRSNTSSSHAPPHSSNTAPYSFDVFRPSSSGLVHASSSSRSQGILRSTRADAGKKHTTSPTDDDDEQNEDDGSKRYACAHCGKRFTRPSSLKTHEIVHSDEKPYECPHPGCGKTFTVPSNMRRHYRKTHEAPSGGHSGSGDEDADEYYTHQSQHQDTRALPSSGSSYYTSSRRR